MRTQRLKRFGVTLFVVLFGLSQSACGGPTLASIGRYIGPVGQGFNDYLDQLKAAGEITQENYDKAKNLNLPGKAKEVGDYLQSLTVINAGNRDEVLAVIDGGLKVFRDVSGLVKPGSAAAKVVLYLSTALSVARGVLAAMPVKPASFSMSAKEEGKRPADVKIDLPPPPPEVKKYLPK